MYRPPQADKQHAQTPEGGTYEHWVSYVGLRRCTVSHCPTEEKYFLQRILQEDFNKTKHLLTLPQHSEGWFIKPETVLSFVIFGTVLQWGNGERLLATASSWDRKGQEIFSFLLSDSPQAFLKPNSGPELLSWNLINWFWKYFMWFVYSCSFRNIFLGWHRTEQLISKRKNSQLLSQSNITLNFSKSLKYLIRNFTEALHQFE